MKEAFADLKTIFPEMPQACEDALMSAAYSVPVRRLKPVFRPAVALAVALMLALTCAAGAAFHPQIIGWFASHYGESWGDWLEKGSVAAPDITAETDGAVFTIDEVLVRGRGLYVLGTIQPEDGYAIADYDSSSADAKDKTLRYVRCTIDTIGVDGGAMLAPGVWGYAVEEKADGSIAFSMEIEDGMAVEPGTEYTLEMSAYTYDPANREQLSETTWTFTVQPEKMTE